jgi:hypothetical protein
MGLRGHQAIDQPSLCLMMMAGKRLAGLCTQLCDYLPGRLITRQPVRERKRWCPGGRFSGM